MTTPQGRRGMTKKLKRAERLANMQSNRKRDKKSQRSDYHKHFRNAPGPVPLDISKLGCLASKKMPEPAKA